MKQVEWLGWFLYYDGVGVALLPAQALPVYQNFHFNYCTFLLGLSATNCAKYLQGCELQIWQDLSSYRCQNDHLQKIRSWHGHGSWVRERMGIEVKYFWCSEIYLTIRHILDHSPEDQQTQNFHQENRNWIFHHWLVYSLSYIGQANFFNIQDWTWISSDITVTSENKLSETKVMNITWTWIESLIGVLC